ncbi:alpha/beta fold hydrolase [Helicobacter sp. 23-1044]
MAKRSIIFNSQKFAISYKIIDNKSEDFALFLHGWGANKELMEGAFGARFKSINHLYVDLPGFGGSENEFILDSAKYAEILRIFLTSLNIIPKIIFAHSFGGKVATLLNPPNLVLLSSAGLQKSQNLKVKLKIKCAKIARFFGINARFLVSQDAKDLPKNMYETFKIVVREDFSEIFSHLKSKTLIFWGKDDDALPLCVGEQTHKLIADSAFFALEGNHFFFLDSANLAQIEDITNDRILR